MRNGSVKIVANGQSWVELEGVSALTGNVNRMRLPMSLDQYNDALSDWANGRLVQNAFPMLDKAQREFLLTASTQAEWDEAFPPEES